VLETNQVLKKPPFPRTHLGQDVNSDSIPISAASLLLLSCPYFCLYFCVKAGSIPNNSGMCSLMVWVGICTPLLTVQFTFNSKTNCLVCQIEVYDQIQTKMKLKASNLIS